MIIAGIYSFNNGREVIEKDYAQELKEVQEIICSIDSEACKTKISKEKTMPGRLLYQPSKLNKLFSSEFAARSWQTHRISCKYSQKYYTPEYQKRKTQPSKNQTPYREMDFIKNKVGIEVQFGKYAFMVYNVCAKMTIFRNL
ncbi:BglII/BstYI family type II restriction endonuclease, partial [Gloeomargarita sp.]